MRVASSSRKQIQTISKAAEEKRVFPWKPLLELAKWVVDHPVTAATEEAAPEAEDRDPGWTWTRSEIASLLASGFNEAAMRAVVR